MNENKNITKAFLEQIERYYNNSMTVEERTEFENLLKNPEFKSQVEDIKTLILGIETQSLKEQLNKFHKEVIDPNSTQEPTGENYFTFKKIAAAAIIVIAIGSYWFFHQDPNQKLYTKYFTPDPGLPTTMSQSADYEFYDAMVNYKQGDYKTAISKWQTLLIGQPKNDTLNYFLGVAYLANNDERSAIKYLDIVTNTKQSYFKNDAFYYLGLAHLKSDNIEDAIKNLNNSKVDNSRTIILELND